MSEPEKSLPNSPESEEAFLGSLIIGEREFFEAVYALKKVEPRDFFIVRNRWVYEALLSLSDRREPIDNISLGMELRQRGQLEEIGGMAYLTYLINNTPTHIHAEIYAEMVLEASRRRKTLALAQEIGEAALNDPDHTRVLKLLEKGSTIFANAVNRDTDKRLWHVTELANLPRPTWLVYGEIPQRGMTVLCGKAGTGKTFLVLNYAFMVARDLPVVYAALEGKYGLQPRVQGLCKHHKVDMKELELHFWLNPLHLMEPDSVASFLSFIEQTKPCLVVIDTLSRAMAGGDPNAPRDMQTLTDAVDRIQKAIDGAVMLVHHTRKSDNVFSGAGNIFNNAETFMTLQNEDGLLILEADKVKDAEPFRRYFSMISVPLEHGESTQVVLPAKQVIQTQADRLFPNQYKVLEALTEYLSGSANLHDLQDVTEVASRGSLIRTLHRLKKLGFIQHGQRGTPYEITMLGRSKYRLARFGIQDDSMQESYDSPHDSSADGSSSTMTLDDSTKSQLLDQEGRGGHRSHEESKMEQLAFIPPRTEYQ